MSDTAVEQAMERAVASHRAGRLGEAEAGYRKVLELSPGDAAALHGLGALAHQVGKLALAAELFGQAVGRAPSNAVYFNNLGLALLGMGRLDEAISAFRNALHLRPAVAVMHANLGNALAGKKDYEAAVAEFEKALAIDPSAGEVYHNLGNALGRLGRIEPTLAAFRAAIERKPGLHQSHHNLGIALMQAGRLDEAAQALLEAIRLKPGVAETHVFLGNVRKDQGDVAAAAECYREATRIDPTLVTASSNLAWIVHFHPDYDARAIADEQARWNDRHALPLRQVRLPHTNDRNPDRRLRIGYVSPNFKEHVVGRNILPLLQHHDHGEFEFHLYSSVDDPDEHTEQFRRRADQWTDVIGMTDEVLAGRIREDRIDILVDLALHLEGNRLLTFARKPVPVQVTFAGYPGSTGLTAIDYRLTDPFLDPPDGDESVYSERAIRLPDTFWCFEPQSDEPVSGLPMANGGVVTFGCLNHFCKTNPAVFAMWRRVLEAVPGSRLMMQTFEGSHRRRAIEALGVEPGRVVFSDRLPRDEYLRLYHQIDIALDTFPYNGHSTSLDALWMGVPVVTLRGRTIVGRAGVSQATNLGMTDLIADSPEQYIAIAVELATDPNRLTKLRAGLRDRMSRSPLMDAPRFARNIESAYRKIWQDWVKG